MKTEKKLKPCQNGHYYCNVTCPAECNCSQEFAEALEVLITLCARNNYFFELLKKEKHEYECVIINALRAKFFYDGLHEMIKGVPDLMKKLNLTADNINERITQRTDYFIEESIEQDEQSENM